MRNPRKLQTYDSGPTLMSVGPFFVRIRGQLGFVRLSLGITHVGTFKIKYAPINAKIASGNQAASTGLGCPPIAMIRRHCSSVVAVGTTIAGSSLVISGMACSSQLTGSETDGLGENFWSPLLCAAAEKCCVLLRRCQSRPAASNV